MTKARVLYDFGGNTELGEMVLTAGEEVNVTRQVKTLALRTCTALLDFPLCGNLIGYW
jgi:hypothetical protein